MKDNTPAVSEMQECSWVERIPPPDLNHIVEVHNVFPCQVCRLPVCLMGFEGKSGAWLVDAVPDEGWILWTADVLHQHHCSVLHLTGSRVLHHLTYDFVEVPNVAHCPGCKALITCVKIGTGEPIWYNAESYLHGYELRARLTEPHRCLADSGEVRQ